MNHRTLLSVSLLVIGVAGHAAEALKTEYFNRDPGWEGRNNRVVPKKVLF